MAKRGQKRRLEESEAQGNSDQREAGPETPQQPERPAPKEAQHQQPLACDVQNRLKTIRELPSCEASVVELALERWAQLRPRMEALRPSLHREDKLMQQILDRGLGGEDRKTLRKLASGGADDEAEIRQVAAAIGAEQHQLQEILMLNHRELLELSTANTPDEKKELLSEMDAVLEELRRAQDAIHGKLLAAKERLDMDAVRTLGRALNELKGLLRRFGGERRSLTKNSALAALLVTVCRRVLPVRQIDPAELDEILPSYDGYLQILDFYFFSDASLYCFGEHYSGPNWFTRLKRNVAILLVQDAREQTLYNAFAVSGEHKTPGVPCAPESSPLRSIEAEDEHGRIFDRRHDAEFKLLTGLCNLFSDKSAEECAAWSGSGVLWSRKPLCRSCVGAVQQVRERLPRFRLEVVVGEADMDDPSAACNGFAGHARCAPSRRLDEGMRSRFGAGARMFMGIGACRRRPPAHEIGGGVANGTLPPEAPSAAAASAVAPNALPAVEGGGNASAARASGATEL